MARARAAKGGTAGSSGAPSVLKFRTRQVSTFRGTAENAYGDQTDVGVPYLTGIPAAIAETSDMMFDQASQRHQIVRSVTCRVDNWADIITTDTLLDTTTGIYYIVESIEAEPGPGIYPPQKILTLRERSGVSIQSD